MMPLTDINALILMEAIVDDNSCKQRCSLVMNDPIV